MADGTAYQRETFIPQMNVFSADFLHGKGSVIFQINRTADSYRRFFDFSCSRMMLFKLCFGGIDKIRESAVFNALHSKLVVILEVVDMDNVTVNLIADFVPQKIGIHLDLMLIVLGCRVSKLHAGQVGEIRLV